MSKWFVERIRYEVHNFYFHYVEDKPVVACGPRTQTNIKRNFSCIIINCVVCGGSAADQILLRRMSLFARCYSSSSMFV